MEPLLGDGVTKRENPKSQASAYPDLQREPLYYEVELRQRWDPNRMMHLKEEDGWRIRKVCTFTFTFGGPEIGDQGKIANRKRNACRSKFRSADITKARFKFAACVLQSCEAHDASRRCLRSRGAHGECSSWSRRNISSDKSKPYRGVRVCHFCPGYHRKAYARPHRENNYYHTI